MVRSETATGLKPADERHVRRRNKVFIRRREILNIGGEGLDDLFDIDERILLLKTEHR